MNAITFQVPDEIKTAVDEIAGAQGTSVEALLAEYTTHMVRQYAAYQHFQALAQRGEEEVEQALQLLRR